MNTKTNVQSPVITVQQIRSIIESGNENIFNEVMAVVEKPLLQETLVFTRGNQTRAAAILGLNRGTFRKRLKIHGIMK